MAMGHPVVGTVSATQGVEGQDGRDYLVADTADALYEAVARLLEHPEEGAQLGRRGRAFVEERYDWEVVFDPLDELLARLVPEPRG
jgi:colanic acid/amylovoran biosynthesis glycosyltransferase